MRALQGFSALTLLVTSVFQLAAADPAPNVKPVTETAREVGTPTTHQHFRVSKLESMRVYNTAGDELGKVKDIVLDIGSGKVGYVALEYGGFLGIGDKLFAVPWHAFKVVTHDKEHRLVLDMPKDRLKNAPGFDKEHWPDMADPNWSAPVDQYYGAPKTTSLR